MVPCGLPRQNLSLFPATPPPPQTEVCSTMGESVRPPSFHNPTLSANKNVAQICRFSLSAADGVANGSGERRTSPSTVVDAQSGNGNERSLRCAVVPQSLAVSAITFPAALSLSSRRDACERSPDPCFSQRQNRCHLKRKYTSTWCVLLA